eukprot:175400-Prorocentrum_minimum.AAC.1
MSEVYNTIYLTSYHLKWKGALNQRGVFSTCDTKRGVFQTERLRVGRVARTASPAAYRDGQVRIDGAEGVHPRQLLAAHDPQ